MKNIVTIIILILAFSNLIEGANILILSPLGSKSANNFFMIFAEPLAEKGHQVTFVSKYKNSKEIPNFKEVLLSSPGGVDLLKNVFEVSETSFLYDALETIPHMCVTSLGSKEVQDLKKETYDLIIFSIFADFCFLSLVHHFKVPLIYATSGELYPPFNSMMGNFVMPSLEKNLFLTAPTFPFSFWERFQSVSAALISGGLTMLIDRRMRNLCIERDLCPEDMPSFSDFHSNVSLSITNGVRSLEWPPRPVMPHVIHIGGGHIHEPKPLPHKLESWIGDSSDGFIFFSLGSAAKPSDMPEKYRNIFVNVFGSLKLKILWKWDEETIPNLPANVKLQKWLPQQDILAHPKLKLFITHGGLLSSHEASYFGVPLLGMPLFFDQKSNMATYCREGWAKVINWKELEETIFREAILELINNSKYRKMAQERSKLMKDKPYNPSKESVYWIEYVLRHGGADHLKSPLHKISFFTLYNVDVYAVLIGCLLLLIWGIKKLLLTGISFIVNLWK